MVLVVSVLVIRFLLFYQSRRGAALSVPLACRWGWHDPLYGAWGDDRCRRCGGVS